MEVYPSSLSSRPETAWLFCASAEPWPGKQEEVNPPRLLLLRMSVKAANGASQRFFSTPRHGKFIMLSTSSFRGDRFVAPSRKIQLVSFLEGLVSPHIRHCVMSMAVQPRRGKSHMYKWKMKKFIHIYLIFLSTSDYLIYMNALLWSRKRSEVIEERSLSFGYFRLDREKFYCWSW